MKEPKFIRDGMGVVFGPCRLSYCHLWEPQAAGGGTEEPRYSTAVIIPKAEKATVKALQTAIKAAYDLGIRKSWGGKAPKNWTNPLRDGDEKDKDDDGVYAGVWYINAKSKNRPTIVDREGHAITDQEDVYSGCWAAVSVTFFPFKQAGNVGVGVGLNHVMKWKDDDYLGGRSSAESDFEGFDTSDDDDDDDL